MDNRRLILFVVFTFSLLMLWDAWQKQGQPQPTDLSQLTPEQLRTSIVLTVLLAASPMLILFGWMSRWKQ